MLYAFRYLLPAFQLLETAFELLPTTQKAVSIMHVEHMPWVSVALCSSTLEDMYQNLI